MKISGQLQAEIFKLALFAIAGGAAFYAIKKLGGSVAGTVGDTFKRIVEMPGKAVDAAVEAVKETATATGSGWQEMYTEAPGTHETGGKYNSPLVNDSGMDFSPFGGLSG